MWLERGTVLLQPADEGNRLLPGPHDLANWFNALGRYVTAASIGTVTANVVGATVSMSMVTTNPTAGGAWSANVTVRGDQMEGTSSDYSRVTTRVTATRASLDLILFVHFEA